MDPAITLELFLEAVEAEDFDLANERLSDMKNWFAKGGFAPRVDRQKLEGLMSNLVYLWGKSRGLHKKG